MACQEAYQDLRQFLSRLEEEGLLVRVKDRVDWNLEVGHIMWKNFEAQGPAVLFENVKDSSHPLLAGALYTYRRLGLGVGAEGNLRAIMRKTLHCMQNPIEPVLVDSGPCQENVLIGDDIDLHKFPAPWWHEGDGGQFIATLGVVVSRDPFSGVKNASIIREQVMSKNLTGFKPNQQTATMYQKYQAIRRPMPIATAIGVTPEVTLAAVCIAPYGQDELGIAGALRGSPLPVVKCKTVDLEVPATAEIVLEGFVDPDASSWMEEGPMGEFPGYFGGSRLPRPTIRLTAITHRNNPICQGTMEGPPPNESSTIRSVGHSVGAWGRLLAMGVPGVKEVHFTEMGCAQFVVVVSMERQYYGGNARQVIEGLWATSSKPKIVIVVDDDIDIFDPGQVEWALATRVQPHRDMIITSDGEVGTTLDPSIEPGKRPYPNARTSRIGIDATKQFKGFDFPAKARPSDEALRLVQAKWSGKGLF